MGRGTPWRQEAKVLAAETGHRPGDDLGRGNRLGLAREPARHHQPAGGGLRSERHPARQAGAGGAGAEGARGGDADALLDHLPRHLGRGRDRQPAGLSAGRHRRALRADGAGVPADELAREPDRALAALDAVGGRLALSRRSAPRAGRGLRAVRGARAAAGGRDRARVLPRRHDRRGADAAAVAGDAQVPRRRRGALDRRPRSFRGVLHRRLRRLRRARGAGGQRDLARTAAGSSRSTCCTCPTR